MPKLTNRVPRLRRHKASGLVIVTIRYEDHYLGPYDSAECRAKYDQLIAQWMASGRQGINPAHAATVAEVANEFLILPTPGGRASVPHCG